MDSPSCGERQCPISIRKEEGNKRGGKKPHLSGREGGSRERKEGEDCVSAASSAAPSEASVTERKSPIPGDGSSWFVLLTEEKNEQKSPSWIPHHAGNDNTPFQLERKKGTKGKKEKPPLSGREGGSRERKEGEDCVSAASSAAPSEASVTERKSPIPGDGSSWFVLLTEEKNEQKRGMTKTRMATS